MLILRLALSEPSPGLSGFMAAGIPMYRLLRGGGGGNREWEENVNLRLRSRINDVAHLANPNLKKKIRIGPGKKTNT